MSDVGFGTLWMCKPTRSRAINTAIVNLRMVGKRPWERERWGRKGGEDLMSPREAILELRDRMSQSIIGQDHVVERLLLTLLCNGNTLLEGLPGLADGTRTRADWLLRAQAT